MSDDRPVLMADPTISFKVFLRHQARTFFPLKIRKLKFSVYGKERYEVSHGFGWTAGTIWVEKYDKAHSNMRNASLIMKFS